MIVVCGGLTSDELLRPLTGFGFPAVLGQLECGPLHAARLGMECCVFIPDNLVVGEDADADARRFRRSEGGVTLITQPMIDKLGS